MKIILQVTVYALFVFQLYIIYSLCILLNKPELINKYLLLAFMFLSGFSACNCYMNITRNLWGR